MVRPVMSLVKKLAVLGVVLSSSAALAQSEVKLLGAGASFPSPLYQRWVTEFQKVHPNVKIDYQSIGSGGGIKGITEKTIHFAGSDAPMNKKELDAVGGADKVIEFPTCAGGVVPAFNVPGAQTLNFTGDVLADIFRGKIAKWNDPRLVELNKDVKLPDLAITPAWRTDGSGTTFVFSNYLTTQSEAFKTEIGAGKQVKWPVGQGGKGNEGVAAVVQQTQGAIGYIEVNYANQNHINFGAVKNKAGKFVKASTDSVSAAGAGAVADMKGNLLAADIWNQGGDNSYPIAAFTYMIFYKDMNNLKTADEANNLMAFFTWATTDGQKFATELDYAPLAPAVQAKVKDALKMATFQGKPVAAPAR